MPSSTRWRVLVTATGSTPAGAVVVSEIEMHTSIGGANVCTGGTPSASSAQASFPVANAFDGNSSNFWASATPPTQWIEYQFASAQDIVEFAITAAPDANVFAAPRDFQLQYFDGSSWVSTISRKFEGFTASQKRTYSASYPTATKQVWRLNISAVTTENPGIGDLVLRTAVNGANQATGGTASGTGSFNQSYTPAAAFDGTNSSYWASSNPSPQWISYQFTSAKDIVQYVVSAPIGDQAHAPTAWTLEYYDPVGDTWTVADTRTGQGTWTSGEARTFTLAGASVIADTYWRILVTASYGTTWNQVGCEVEWLDAGNTDLSYPGIPVITSGDEGGLGSANLYDNDASTFHQWIGGSPLPLYSGVNFSAATSTPAITKVSLTAHASWASRMPQSFKVQKSTSGNSNDWTDVATFTNEPAWSANEKRTYTLVSASAATAATKQAQTTSATGSVGVAATVTSSQAQSASAQALASTPAGASTAQAQSTIATGSVGVNAQVESAQAQSTSAEAQAILEIDSTAATAQAQGTQAVGSVSVDATASSAQAQATSAQSGISLTGTIAAAQAQSSTAVGGVSIAGDAATTQAQTTHAEGFATNVAAGTLSARISITPAVHGALHF